MTYRLEVTSVGSSIGVILPEEIVQRLGLKSGDVLCAINTPIGVELTPHDPEFAAQLEVAKRVMARTENSCESLPILDHSTGSELRFLETLIPTREQQCGRNRLSPKVLALLSKKGDMMRQIFSFIGNADKDRQQYENPSDDLQSNGPRCPCDPFHFPLDSYWPREENR